MTRSKGNDTESTLMTLPDVARYLAMKERTIYVWAQEGRLPAFKLGVSWRFRRSEIDAWLETRRTGPKVSSGRQPLVPPVEHPPGEWQKEQERRKLVEECKTYIEDTMRREYDRTEFAVERFMDDPFGEDVVQEAVEQLREERKLSLGERKASDGQRIKVVKRRR